MADFSISGEIIGNAKGFTTAVNESVSSLNGLGDKLKETTSKLNNGFKDWGIDFEQFYNQGSGILSDFGLNLDKLAAKFGINGLLLSAIITATSALVKFGESVNQARANIAKGTGAIGKDLVKMQDTFQDVLISGVGRSMDEISNMMADINTRFGSVDDELITLTGDFDQFADITGTDVRASINGIADVTKKWGLSTKEINPLMQQLSMTAKMSGASVTDLMNSLKTGQATFQQFGMSATQSMAFLGTLAHNGIESTTAMQGLKTALVKFTAEGKNAKQGLAEISEKIKNANSDSEALNLSIETFGSKAGVEMVKVLKNGSLNAEEFADALRNAGGSMEATYEQSRSLSSAIDDFKSVVSGAFVNLGSGLNDMFRDIVDSITMIVRPIIGTLSPIFDTIGEAFSFVGKVIKEFVTNVQKLQNRLSGGFNTVREVFLAFRDMVRRVLGNAFDIFKNVFGLIFDILDGKWALVWERTKLILLKAVDTILSIISGLANAITSIINGILSGINVVLDAVDIDTITLIPSLDLSEVTGLSGVIEEVEGHIRDLSGETEESIIGDLGEVADVSVDTFGTMEQTAEVTFGNLKELSGDWSAKLKAQEIEMLKDEMNREVERAKNAGATEEEIYNIKVRYNDRLKPLLIEQVEMQRKAELEKVKVSKESAENIIAESRRAGGRLTAEQQKTVDNARKLIEKADTQIVQINSYYNREIEKISNSTVDKIAKSTKNIAEENKTWWQKFIDKVKEDAEDWGDVFDTLEKTVKDFAQNGLETIGASLVEGKDAWKGFGASALEAIAQILEALGKQLTALAVTKAVMGDYGKAALATAGATAAFVGAGALKAVAKAMNTVKDSTSGAVNSLKDFRKALKEAVEGAQSIDTFITSQSVILQNAELSKNTLKETANDYYRIQEDLLNKINQKLQTKGLDFSEKNELKNLYDKISSGKFVSTTSESFKKYAYGMTDSKTVQKLKDFNTLLGDFEKYETEYKEAIKARDEATQNAVRTLEDENSSLQNVINLYQQFYKDNLSNSDSYLVTLENQKELLNETLSIYQNLVKTSSEIGKNLIDNILDGATKEDFFGKMRDYLKENIIKLTVYNEEFTRRLAGIGEMMNEAIVQGATEGDAIFDVLKIEMNDLYDDVSEKTKNIDNILNQFFEKTEEESEDWAEETAENLSTFEQNMKSFRESIKDLGGSLGSEFVNALSNGMNLNDFMDSFKKFIKNMLVQTVVYTDSMKGKIEAIGKKITDALKSGTYSEDLFSDMKREISLTFDEAFLQTSIIDDLLNKGFDLNAFATGTNNAERGLALVGEQGAELIDFKGGERVYNAKNTADILSGASGTSNNFNVTFNNVQDTTAFTMMNQLRRYNREMAITGVI